MSNEANPLVPNQEELDNADAMLASLSNIAYANTKPEPKVAVRTRRSKFFFKLTKSFAEEVEAQKKTFVPKQLVHIDAEIEKRLSIYKKEMPRELAFNIERVREFFLQEIAPITLAANAGATQALEVARRLVKSDIDATQFEKFERMAALAVDIKMARFIAREFGLTKAEATEILNGMKPRQPQLIPIGVPNDRSSQSTKEAKKASNPS